jgi:hypothetical protein
MGSDTVTGVEPQERLFVCLHKATNQPLKGIAEELNSLSLSRRT